MKFLCEKQILVGLDVLAATTDVSIEDIKNRIRRNCQGDWWKEHKTC